MCYCLTPRYDLQLCIFFFKDLFIIYLFNLFLVASGLSCGRHGGSFVVARGLLSSCGMRVFSSLVGARRLQGVWAL